MKARVSGRSASSTGAVTQGEQAQRPGPATQLQASPRMVAQRQQVEAAFGSAPLQRQDAGPGVVQLQVNSGIASLAALTPANWLQLLRTNRINTYMWNNQPMVRSGQGAQGDTYLLVWANAIQFGDGTLGDLHIHMHEGMFDLDALAGGGAWVDGGAPGHGQNVGGIPWVKATCVEWINSTYDSKCTVG